MFQGKFLLGMGREGAGLPAIGGSISIGVSRDIRSTSVALLKIVMISLLPDSDLPHSSM